MRNTQSHFFGWVGTWGSLGHKGSHDCASKGEDEFEGQHLPAVGAAKYAGSRWGALSAMQKGAA